MRRMSVFNAVVFLFNRWERQGARFIAEHSVQL